MGRRIAALVRHGDYCQRDGAPSAHQPFALTARGRDQARGAAAALTAGTGEFSATLDPVLDSSRMLRAWQTADAMASILGAETTVESFDDLAERGVGAVANLTEDEIRSIVERDPRFDPLPRDWKADSHYCLPFQGAESLMAAGVRVARHLQARMAALPPGDGGSIVKAFVGHGAAFRHAAHHLGVLSFEDIARLSMHHARPVFLEISPSGEWRHVSGAWKIRGKGDTPLD
mgnify:CR=1 FL=1